MSFVLLYLHSLFVFSCRPKSAKETVLKCVDNFVQEQLTQNRKYEACFKREMGGHSSGCMSSNANETQKHESHTRPKRASLAEKLSEFSSLEEDIEAQIQVFKNELCKIKSASKSILKPSNILAYRQCTGDCVNAKYIERIAKFKMPPAFLCAQELNCTNVEPEAERYARAAATCAHEIPMERDRITEVRRLCQCAK